MTGTPSLPYSPFSPSPACLTLPLRNVRGGVGGVVVWCVNVVREEYYGSGGGS